MPDPGRWWNQIDRLMVAILVGAGVLATLAPGLPARAQEPASPAPGVPATISLPTPEAALEVRLRQMEEMYNKQFAKMAKQNEALSKKVEALTKKLDAKTKADGDNSGATDEVRGARGDNISLSTRSNEAPPSSPSLSQPKQGPTRTGLKGFYDQRQRNRYGYVLQSQDEEYEIRFNGLLQSDSRINSPHNGFAVSDLDIPRMRMYMSGRMTKPIEYQLSIQRALNNLDLLNAWVNFHYDDRLQVRLGRHTVPFTYEWYKMSIWEMATPERSPFANNFGGNRQVGAMAWGNLLQDRFEYALGIFDGPRNSYQDTNNAKDVMALMDVRPFYDRTDSVWKNFSFGGSVDAGKQDNPPAPRLLRATVTASGNPVNAGTGDALVGVPFLAFNGGVRERGQRELFELHSTYFYKGLSFVGSWDSGRDDYARPGRDARPVNLPVSGYSVQLAYIVTGESLEKRALVEPIHPFDLRSGKFGLGALELQARVSGLTLGNQVFTGGLADPNLWSNRVDLLDLGLNWYLTKHVKVYFDWEHAVYGQPIFYGVGQPLRKSSDLFWLRAQLYF